jgi:hypothetical protein
MHTAYILLLIGLYTANNVSGQTTADKDVLISFVDTVKDEYGYKNLKGDTIIPLGKYSICFTDTFNTYAIVTIPHKGFVAIDRQENILYYVFPFDNGPDYVSDGLFRILIDGKIGYADSATGKIIIKPQFDCAWPFENGIAKVSTDCKTKSDGEHSTWLSDSWFYIDKTGKKVNPPKTK